MDRLFMQEALKEARKRMLWMRFLVGAVIVCDGEVYARDTIYERPWEILPLMPRLLRSGMLRENGKLAVAWDDHLCYSGTLPHVCRGYGEFALDRVVFGAADPKGGAVVSLMNLVADDRLNHRLQVEEECWRESKNYSDGFSAKRKEQPKSEDKKY